MGNAYAVFIYLHLFFQNEKLMMAPQELGRGQPWILWCRRCVSGSHHLGL
jgi:hypothetical protein